MIFKDRAPLLYSAATIMAVQLTRLPETTETSQNQFQLSKRGRFQSTRNRSPKSAAEVGLAAGRVAAPAALWSVRIQRQSERLQTLQALELWVWCRGGSVASD